MTTKDRADKNDSHQLKPRPPAQVLYMAVADRIIRGESTQADVLHTLTHGPEIARWVERLRRNAQVQDIITPTLKQQLQQRFSHKSSE
jgi:hypothetical protein